MMDHDVYKRLVGACAHTATEMIVDIGQSRGLSDARKMLLLAAVGDTLRSCGIIALARIESFDDVEMIRQQVYDMHNRHVEEMVALMRTLGIDVEVRDSERSTDEKPQQD